MSEQPTSLTPVPEGYAEFVQQAAAQLTWGMSRSIIEQAAPELQGGEA